MSNWIIPDWPAPSRVRALTSTRQGGVSEGPYASMNLGNHVDDVDYSTDSHASIETNRQRFRHQLPGDPEWLNQVHKNSVVDLTKPGSRVADASYTTRPNQVAVILTADCLPILITDVNASVVAAIHGGWRSLAQGIIGVTIEELNLPPQNILAWLGPAIGPKHFQVGQDVYAAFPDSPQAFVTDGDRWKADIFALARDQLKRHGVTKIYGGDTCTFSNPDRFYSHRRDAGITGRMATAIWLTPDSMI